MNTAINNQTSVNYLLQEQEKAEKRGQARIAQSHHAAAKHKTTKDTILPSAGDANASKTGKGKGTEGKPKLPTPLSRFSGLNGDDGEDGGKTLGLIAIIGEVMALQAKSNSNFWSTLWKQASQSMMMEVKFAPIIGDAIKNAANEQSQATKAQADMSKDDGMISLVGFGSCAAGALASEYSEAKAANNTDSLTEDEGAGAANASKTEDSDLPATLQTDGENPTEQTQPERLEEDGTAGQTAAAQNRAALKKAQDDVAEAGDTKGPWTKRKEQMQGLLGKAGKGFKRLQGVAAKTVQQAMGISMLTQGSQGLFVDNHYNSKKADHEEAQGQSQALDKESEQYSQFYGQAFQRSEGLREGTQQNLDYAMNILKSAADSITQTVNSMFRG